MSNLQKPTLHLLVETGPHRGLEISCTETRLRIGRAPSNGFCLDADTTVSQEHALLYCAQGQWFVEDLKSRNGVVVEDSGVMKRISTAAVLKEGSRFHLGSTRLAVSFDLWRYETRTEPVAAETTEARLVLQIRLESDHLKYRFSGQSPLSTQYSMPFASQMAKGIEQRLDVLVGLANVQMRGNAEEELREIGKMIAAHLVPARVTEKLAEVKGGPLVIVHDSELLGIPWELAALEGESWCERFALARQVVLEDISLRGTAPRAEGRKRLLMVCNPTGDLVDAQAEAEGLLSQLSPHEPWLDIEFLAGPRVTTERLLREMNGADLVYYVGHGVFNPESPDQSGWVLHDGHLSLSYFRNLAAPPRMVFSNACDSARETAQPKAAYGLAQNVGMASRFLLAGVDAYLGALWPIHAESAASFASEFLHSLFGSCGVGFQPASAPQAGSLHHKIGRPLGEAVRLARHASRTDAQESELVWASYVLYGDPLLRLGGPRRTGACK
ncbi:MAG: CHAT domain-containing protein [Candidatus Hydrogenedentes bacterium]|nr:CHAT domain-containing protein [Candidatus Hydrogenedentota bacterium]